MTNPTPFETETNWSTTREKLKRKWAQLTEDDLQRLQQRTGESREAIERTYRETASDRSAGMYRRFLSRNWLGLS